MPPELTEVIENEEVEGNDEDFNAGFDDKVTAPTETPDAIAPSEEPADAGNPAAAAPEYVQITKDELAGFRASAAAVEELRATLTSNSDKAFGKIGGIERLIKDLQASTAAGDKVQLSDEDMAEMSEEYPELASMQRKVLNAALSKVSLRGTAESFDPAVMDELVNTRLQAAMKTVDERVEFLTESRLLSREHPDWKTIVDAGKPDSKNAYRTWLATQPAEYQKTINETFDSGVLSAALTKFKAKASTPQRQSRIDLAAAAPRGVGGHADTETDDDEFNEGFRKG